MQFNRQSNTKGRVALICRWSHNKTLSTTTKGTKIHFVSYAYVHALLLPQELFSTLQSSLGKFAMKAGEGNLSNLLMCTQVLVYVINTG